MNSSFQGHGFFSQIPSWWQVDFCICLSNLITVKPRWTDWNEEAREAPGRTDCISINLFHQTNGYLFIPKFKTGWGRKQGNQQWTYSQRDKFLILKWEMAKLKKVYFLTRDYFSYLSFLSIKHTMINIFSTWEFQVKMMRSQCVDQKIKGAELSCTQSSLDERQDCSSSSVLITKEETEQFYEVLWNISAPQSIWQFLASLEMTRSQKTTWPHSNDPVTESFWFSWTDFIVMSNYVLCFNYTERAIRIWLQFKNTLFLWFSDFGEKKQIGR